MKRIMLAAAFFIIVAATPAYAVSSRTLTKSPRAVCTISSVRVSKTTGVSQAVGYCKLAGKKVAVRWVSTVRTFDSQGNTCGSTVVGKSNKLHLKLPGNFTVRFTVQTKKKYGGRLARKTKSFTIDIGGDRLRCAAFPATGIDPSQVCVTNDPSQPCGVPVPNAPALLTKPWLTVDDSFVTVHAGEIASRGGCVLKPAQGVPASQQWLGGQVVLGIYFCADGTGLIPAMSVAYSPDGATQYRMKPPYMGQGAFAASLQFPANCGGELDVTFGIQVQVPNKGAVGNELSNAQLKLPGKNDCSQLAANG